jgi:flagellar export protein FliJ
MEPVFTFRAQPALDVRKRELDAGAASWARGVGTARGAPALHGSGADIARRARSGARHAAHAGVEQYVWHRVWIDRVERAKAAHAVTVAQRQDDVAKARPRAARPKQRVDAMEKLKEKALSRVGHEARLREQRELDALATMRFVADARSRKEEGIVSIGSTTPLGPTTRRRQRTPPRRAPTGSDATRSCSCSSRR